MDISKLKHIITVNKKYLPRYWYFLIFAFLLWSSLYVFYPGFLVTSHWQYRQALELTPISNFNPALFSFTWKILINIFGHYASYMIFNEAMLWCGLILTVTSIIKKHWLATALILFVGLGPYYFPYIPHYYKDIPMGASMLLSFGLLLKAREPNKTYFIFIALYFLFFAISVRHNAFIAVFPVCLSITHILKKKSTFFKRRTNMKGIVLFLLIFLLSGLTNKILSRHDQRKNPGYPIQTIFVFDLVGTSVNADQILWPEGYKYFSVKYQNIDVLKADFRPDTLQPINWFSGQKNKEDLYSISRLWLSAIVKHPMAYLQHRLNYFGHFLYPREGNRRSINGNYIDLMDELEKSKKVNKFELKILNWYYYSDFKGSILRKPIVVFILYILMIIWLFRRKFKDDPVIIGFTFGGFFYLLTYLFIGMAVKFRYAWPSVIFLPQIIIYFFTQYEFCIRKIFPRVHLEKDNSS